jgi:CheY-like chemotaxis protein
MIKNHPSSAGVPVILATAHAMRGDAENLLAESGANDYVAKPIVDHGAFVAQVKSLLEEAA